MKTEKIILDACCGGRMFWFDRNHPNALYVDKRSENITLCDGRHYNVAPDMVADFTHLPFVDNSFKMVIFDPPHLVGAGAAGWLAKKYGTLPKNWQPMIRDGFAECWRVLDINGTLIFKWNENNIKVSDIIKTIGQQPLVGTRNARNKTVWLVFMKIEQI